MGQRRNVDNLGYFDTCTVHGTDSAFAAVTWTLNVGFNLTEAEVECYLGAIFGCHLGCIGRVLLRTAESHLTSRRPRDYLTFAVSQRHNDVIE